MARAHSFVEERKAAATKPRRHRWRTFGLAVLGVFVVALVALRLALPTIVRAVHVGARIVSQAAPGEILVSSTVKDLVAGSGLEFADRGDHTLKGVPGESRLFAAT
jgi:class 3 adenylate cyclase